MCLRDCALVLIDEVSVVYESDYFLIQHISK